MPRAAQGERRERSEPSQASWPGSNVSMSLCKKWRRLDGCLQSQSLLSLSFLLRSWGCAAYNADNNKCIKEINILFMFAPRCIRMHARPSVVCVCIQRVCGCEWEFVKQFLCSNFQSRHAPEIHCHLKHTMLHAAIHHPPLKPPFSFYFIIVHIGLLFTVAGNSLNVSVSSNHNTYIC